MSTPPHDADPTRILMGFASQFMQDTSKVYSNLGQEIIITTEDKIRLCLIEHLSRMEKRNAWIAPLGILITIIIVFPTTTFREFLFFSADTWKAIFVISGIIAVVWLARALLQARISSSLTDVVRNIKATGITQNPMMNQSQDWFGLLISRKWILVFRPPNQSKPISFLSGGAVGEGQNQNEHTWRIQDGKLELIQEDGHIHSRFNFDEKECRFNNTNDSDTPSVRSQIIHLA